MPCLPVPEYVIDFMLLTPIAVAAVCKTLCASLAAADPAISVARLIDSQNRFVIFILPVILLTDNKLTSGESCRKRRTLATGVYCGSAHAVSVVPAGTSTCWRPSIMYVVGDVPCIVAPI